MAEHDSNYSSEDRPHDLAPLVPEKVLPFHPLVIEPLSLLVDPSVGVIVGRNSSHHDKFGSQGIGLIGAITETHEDVLESLFRTPVHLDLSDSHVVFVSGTRGSGKSYTMGVIVEELARSMQRHEIEVAVVVVDTVDVFRQMVEPNSEQIDLLKQWGLTPTAFSANVYVPKNVYDRLPRDVIEQGRLFPLSISPRFLSPSDWGFVMEKSGSLSTTMENLLGEVIESLLKGYILDDGERIPPNPDFSIGDMMKCIRMNPSLDEFYKKPTRIALIQRLRSVLRYGVFNPGGVSAEDLAVPGKITIIDVAPIGDDADRVLAILTNLLCRQILRSRMEWTSDGSSARDILPPTWLVIDEAHTLAPRSGSTPAKEAVISYTKLGRKFGCSLVLATQQPSAVADEAISQADLLISHALSYESDISALQKRAPAVMPEVFRDKWFISSLEKGVALIFDQKTENKRGFMVQIRPRLSKHGGDDRLSLMFSAPAPPGISEVELEEEDTVDAELDDDVVPDDSALISEVKPEKLIDGISVGEDQPFTRPVEEPAIEPIRPVIDLTPVNSHEFGPMPPDLLSKAIIRQVLYSPPSHRFLFNGDTSDHVEEVICREDADSTTLAHSIVMQLISSDFQVNDIVNYQGFSFVLLASTGSRCVLSVAHTSRRACVGIVFVGLGQHINESIRKLREV